MEIIKIRNKNHAFLQIDCDYGVAQELSEFFEYYVPGYKFIPAYKNKMWDGKIRLFDLRSHELPSGLFQYVKEFASTPGRDYVIELEHCNYYGIPDSKPVIDMNFISSLTLSSGGKKIVPRDYQLEAIHHGLCNKKALLISPTASGKSLIIYILLRYYLNNHSKKILIIVPTTSLVEQLYKDFEDYSQYDDNFDAESMCHKIYSGKAKIFDQRIVITTWQSVYKLQGQWFEPYGMVLGDEAHNFKAKSLTSILTKCKEAEYRFGTTGTLDGTTTHKLVLEGGFGPAYYVTTTKKLMDSGSLAQLDISVLLLKYSEAECKLVNKAKYPEEVDYIVRHKRRNQFISKLALDQDGNTLVLYQYVEKHGKPLYDIIKSLAHTRRKVFFVSGGTDVETREQTRTIVETEKNAIIVASLGTFSTGINIKNLHNIIFASPSKSQIKVLQSIGRGLRKSDDGRETKLFDIADDLHYRKNKNFTLNHAAERIKIYTREKFKYKIYDIKI